MFVNFRFTAKTGSRSILGLMEIPLFKTAEEYQATKKAVCLCLWKYYLLGRESDLISNCFKKFKHNFIPFQLVKYINPNFKKSNQVGNY